MNLFRDVRNFINDNDSKIIIYDNLVNIISFKEIIDINSSSIKIRTNKKIDIFGKDLSIIKMLDNEILIEGSIKGINIDE